MTIMDRNSTSLLPAEAGRTPETANPAARDVTSEHQKESFEIDVFVPVPHLLGDPAYVVFQPASSACTSRRAFGKGL